MRIASELVALNDDRKEMTAKGVETAVEIYERDNYEKDRVLVIYLPDVHESIAGIIAGRIREKYNKPTFILTKSEDGVKGSGRSSREADDLWKDTPCMRKCANAVSCSRSLVAIRWLQDFHCHKKTLSHSVRK